MPSETDEPKHRLGFLYAEWWPVRLTGATDPSLDPHLLKLLNRRRIVALHGPGVLYHYTTVSGLLGILDERAIWASHIRYVNDAEEVIHGRRLAIDVLKRSSAKPRFKQFRKVIDSTLDRMVPDFIPDYFVASFSTIDDDLTQWRAYGKDQGVSIGFDPSLPDAFVHIYLPVRAVYKNRDKYRLIIMILERYFIEYQRDLEFYKGNIPVDFVEDYADSLVKKLERDFIRFKHPSFETEQEVRAVIYGSEEDKLRPRRHRVNGSAIVPYHRTCDRLLKNADGTDMKTKPLPLSSVRIGPMQNQELCEISVRDALRFYGYDPSLVSLSTTPYRAH